MRTLGTLAAVLVLLVAPSTALAAGQVLIVDPFVAPQPPSIYSNPQTAINAATDGDLIRVKATFYANIVISGKSLTLVGEPSAGDPGRPRFSSIEVTGLAANQRVVVRAIDSQETLHFTPSSFFVHDNAGPVVLEDVHAFSTGVGFASDDPILRIKNCASATLVRCTVSGKVVAESQAGLPFPIGAALSIVGSTVYLHGGTYTGGRGGHAATVLFSSEAFHGAPAILHVSGSLFVAGAEIRGGDGGDGFLHSTLGCLAEGNGGPGIIAGGLITRFDSVIEGGAPGLPAGSCPSIALPGPAIQQIAGATTSLPGVARQVVNSAPQFLGATATLTLDGLAGDTFLLLVSPSVSTLFVPSLQEATLVQLPAVVVPLGSLASSGATSIPVAIPSGGLPPGIGGVDLFVQALVVGTDGDGVLSSPSATIIAQP